MRTFDAATDTSDLPATKNFNAVVGFFMQKKNFHLDLFIMIVLFFLVFS